MRILATIKSSIPDYRLLLEYVVHEDEATSSAAALALKYVMQTTEGREGVSFTNHCVYVVHPVLVHFQKCVIFL